MSDVLPESCSATSASNENGLASERAIAIDSVQKSGGISIAAIGDPGPSDEVVAQTINRDAFRPQVGKTIACMSFIVAAIGLAVLLDASAAGIVIVAAAICFLVGTASVIHSMLRWEHAENAYER